MPMKFIPVIVVILLGVIAVGCDSERDEYSGLSDLVAKRNEVRQVISEKSATRKKSKTDKRISDSLSEDEFKQIAKQKELSADVLYEKDVEIVDSFSREPLAQGIAYINKKGRIVKIKIIKE